MGIIKQAVGIAAAEAGKSDFQHRLDDLQGREPVEPLRYRIRLHNSGDWHYCRICGECNKWALEGDVVTVWVCEWDTPEHQPIEAGRLGLRVVDSVAGDKVGYAELVTEE